MSTVDNNFYIEVGTTLETNNKGQIHKYLYAQNYVRDDTTHPFNPIVPLTEEFFGPKNLTLLIISKRYILPNGGSVDALNTIKRVFKLWAIYKVYIWIDLVLALKVLDASGDDTYYNDMVAMADVISGICTDMKDYGFTYQGKLSDQKDANYFQPYIDAFYKE